MVGASQHILPVSLSLKSVSPLFVFILLSINLSSVNALSHQLPETHVPVLIRLHVYLSGCHLVSCNAAWLF